ncbi:VOC family protein [Desulfobacter curvatus]|uniref:VOC family protein n=1 Tax=Desulfobacter curvatus TaxID=2290 RepID=UPI00036912AF|nr:VOC family protein [Desulfobacter curvatus]
MIKNIRHTGIVVNNLTESRYFYETLLGFKDPNLVLEDSSFIDKILGLNKSTLTTLKMKSPDGQMIELLDFGSSNIKTKREIIESGPTHLAFTVDNIDELYTVLKKRGVDFISAPEVSPDGYAKVSFCRAPEGTYIELVELL